MSFVKYKIWGMDSCPPPRLHWQCHWQPQPQPQFHFHFPRRDKVEPGEFSGVLDGKASAPCRAPSQWPMFGIVWHCLRLKPRTLNVAGLLLETTEGEFRRITWPTLIKFLTLHSFDVSAEYCTVGWTKDG